MAMQHVTTQLALICADAKSDLKETEGIVQVITISQFGECVNASEEPCNNIFLNDYRLLVCYINFSVVLGSTNRGFQPTSMLSG